MAFDTTDRIYTALEARDAEIERLRAAVLWCAEKALSGFRGDVDENSALSDINNNCRAVLQIPSPPAARLRGDSNSQDNALHG